MTTSNAVAVNISGSPDSATMRSTGRSKRRPTTIRPTIVPTMSSAWPMLKSLSAAAAAPSIGNSAIIGIAARSCCSRIENAALPCAEFSCFFSASNCRTNAVDDNASVRPMTMAEVVLRPSNRTIAAIAAALQMICKEPRPNTMRRITHNRDGLSSRPTINSSRTTPSSAKCRMCSGSFIRRRPYGPMAIPAAR